MCSEYSLHISKTKGSQMAISSIHIETGHANFFEHNDRTQNTKNAIFNDEENYISISASKAIELFKSELFQRTKAYIKNSKRKRLNIRTITHLSAIVNLNKEHSAEDIAKVCKYLKETLDAKIIQYVIHRDEGHLVNYATDNIRKLHANTTKNPNVKNYHAHIEFLGIDSNGKSIRRKLTKQYLCKLQDEVAILLNMERGVSSKIDNLEEFYTQVFKETPIVNNLVEFKKVWIETSTKIRYENKPKARRKSSQHQKDFKESEAAHRKQLMLNKKIEKLEYALINMENEKNFFKDQLQKPSNEFQKSTEYFLDRMTKKLNFVPGNLEQDLIEIEKKVVKLLEVEKSFNILEEELNGFQDQDEIFEIEGFCLTIDKELSLNIVNDIVEEKIKDKNISLLP